MMRIRPYFYRIVWRIDNYIFNLRHREYGEDGGFEKLEYIYGFYKDARDDMRIWRFLAIASWIAVILLLIF